MLVNVPGPLVGSKSDSAAVGPFPEATKPFTPMHLRFNGELSECCARLFEAMR